MAGGDARRPAARHHARARRRDTSPDVGDVARRCARRDDPQPLRRPVQAERPPRLRDLDAPARPARPRRREAVRHHPRSSVQDLVDRMLGDGPTRARSATRSSPSARSTGARSHAARSRSIPSAASSSRPSAAAATGSRRRRRRPRSIAALPEDDRAVWATAFYAGLRLGELLALRDERRRPRRRRHPRRALLGSARRA